jgi:hypothetical protein
MPDVSVNHSPSEITSYMLSVGETFREQLEELKKGESAAYIEIMEHVMNLEHLPSPDNAKKLDELENIIYFKLIIKSYKKAITYRLDKVERTVSILDLNNIIVV